GIRRTVEWYLEHQPNRDSDEERRLGDPFDYAAEDRIIHEYRMATEEIRKPPFTTVQYRHPYPHPKKPGEM
ncbi:MAG: hypothetical protein ABIH46_13100, partial [Chloroflexota bacterium]